MKIQRFTEDMKIKHSSEMDSWSVDRNKTKTIKTGTKTLDLNLGSKVIDLFAEYGIGITHLNKKNWLESYHLLLPEENNFEEYRVTINKKQYWEDFIYEYEYDNDIKYDELNDEEKEKIQVIYDELPYDAGDPEIEFSVFLPTNIDKSRLYDAAMADASNYLKVLSESELSSVLEGISDARNILADEIEGIKKFTILKNIKITNENLEDLLKVGYRLYKDSKAIYLFDELLGSKSESSNLFKEWINLIK